MPSTPEETLKWDRRFLQVAKLFSTWSKDPSTQIGSVIVGTDRVIRSTGYNGFARGVADDARLHDREQKYPLIVHAEENAILNGALVGVSLKGCRSYSGWTPCSRCARMLIQVGISEVVFEEREIPERWQADFDLGQRMLTEAGVPFRAVSLVDG
jgi:dCMP deaminase